MKKAIGSIRKSDSAPPQEATVKGKHVAAFLNIQEHYLNQIEKGEKTVDVRINKGKVKDLKKGDLVCFTTGKRMLVAEIDCAEPFANFKVAHNVWCAKVLT